MVQLWQCLARGMMYPSLSGEGLCSRHAISPHCPAPLLCHAAAGAAASYSMTTAAGSMHVALRAVGTRGEASAERGGGAAKGRAFRLVQLLGGQATPTQVGRQQFWVAGCFNAQCWRRFGITCNAHMQSHCSQVALCF